MNGDDLLGVLGASTDDDAVQKLLEDLAYKKSRKIKKTGDAFADLKPHGIQLCFEDGILMSIGFHIQKDYDSGTFKGVPPLGIDRSLTWKTAKAAVGFPVVTEHAPDFIVFDPDVDAGLELAFAEGELATVWLHLPSTD